MIGCLNAARVRISQSDPAQTRHVLPGHQPTPEERDLHHVLIPSVRFGVGPRGSTVHHCTGDLPGPEGSARPDALRFLGQLLPAPIQAASHRQEISWSQAKKLHHFRDQDLTCNNIPATCLSPNALKNDAIAVCTG